MAGMTLCSSLIYYYCVLHYVQVQRSWCSPPMYFFYLLLLLLSCPTFLVPARHSPFLKVGASTPISTPIYASPPPQPPPHSRQPSFVPPSGINFWDWHRPAPIRPGTRESPRRRPPIYLYLIYYCTRPPLTGCNVCRAINLGPDGKNEKLEFSESYCIQWCF